MKNKRKQCNKDNEIMVKNYADFSSDTKARRLAAAADRDERLIRKHCKVGYIVFPLEGG